jgi:hypothetical protein
VVPADDTAGELCERARHGDIDALRHLLLLPGPECSETAAQARRAAMCQRVSALLATWPYKSPLPPSAMQKVVYETALSASTCPRELIQAVHDTDLVDRTMADLAGRDPARREAAFQVFAAIALNPRKPASVRRQLRTVLESGSSDARLASVRRLHLLADQSHRPQDLGDGSWSVEMLRTLSQKDPAPEVREAAHQALVEWSG